MINFMSIHHWFFIFILGIFGLIIGSFLNVVIYRLPIILENDWRQQCLEFFDQTEELHDNVAIYNLAHPASHCPFCNTPITALQNIPVFSYLILGGKCATCQTKIPLRYLLVELLTCILTIIAGVEFGLSFTLIAVLILTYLLIALTFIDIDHQILPDLLTLPLVWIGLFISCFTLFTTSKDAILGGIFGYLSFWAINKLFKIISRQDGMGQGDFKLIAAAGAWLGWQILPFVILTSSISCLIVGGGVLLWKQKSYKTPVPFGPFIALALWIGIIWGFDATQYYLHFFGITWTNV